MKAGAKFLSPPLPSPLSKNQYWRHLSNRYFWVLQIEVAMWGVLSVAVQINKWKGFFVSGCVRVFLFMFVHGSFEADSLHFAIDSSADFKKYTVICANCTSLCMLSLNSYILSITLKRWIIFIFHLLPCPHGSSLVLHGTVSYSWVWMSSRLRGLCSQALIRKG